MIIEKLLPLEQTVLTKLPVRRSEVINDIYAELQTNFGHGKIRYMF